MTTVLAAVWLIGGQGSPSISDVVQKNFQDASFTARIVSGNQRELAKINDDFGQSYRFKYSNVKIKEPYMMRLESNVDDTSILMILNGSKQLLSIPKAKLKKTTDLREEPGRRQTVFDFGLLTPSLFNGLYDAKFVRTDRATGDYVFDVTFDSSKYKDRTRHRIWVDPEKKIVDRREWYNRKGRQQATFFYQNPVKVNGVWVPTQLTVKNTDNVVAGVTKYEDIKVNTGLDDSLFRVG